MEIVIVEDRIDRVVRIVRGLMDSIGKIIIYQSERDFEKSIRPYRKETFYEKIQRVDAWDMYDTLDKMYAECGEAGQPRYLFLFDLCLEDEQVAFSEKLSVIYIDSKENGTEEAPRCFIYTTFDRMQQELDSKFKNRVVNTDLSQDNFLLYRQNPLLCRALSLEPEAGG